MTREDTPRIAGSVTVTPGQKPVFKANDPPAPASDGVQLLFRARQTALAGVPRNGQPLNPVVLPGEAIGQKGIVVYLLAGTTKQGELVFGLHHRVLVSEDGARVVAAMPLSKTALIVSDRDLPPGAKPEGAYVTHLVTDWPLETHVLVSLMHHNQPIYVATRLGNWRVVGDKIDYLGPAAR